MSLVKRTRTCIAGKYAERDVATAMLPGPSFSVSKEGAADPFSIRSPSHGEVTDMAVLRAAEQVGRGLQMQESDPLAGIVLSHENMTAWRLFRQVMRDVAANPGGAFVAIAPRRQFEFDHAINQIEDEVVIVSLRQTDMNAPLAIHDAISAGARSSSFLPQSLCE